MSPKSQLHLVAVDETHANELICKKLGNMKWTAGQEVRCEAKHDAEKFPVEV